ncbi:unnamed protein product [Clavelina lepadiformis]|uniref:Uncharacterized protein n=1 Tax=Clavelina lepadiformis TaxID=159417 RepID=A0ABP0G7U7_CLALP
MDVENDEIASVNSQPIAQQPACVVACDVVACDVVASQDVPSCSQGSEIADVQLLGKQSDKDVESERTTILDDNRDDGDIENFEKTSPEEKVVIASTTSLNKKRRYSLGAEPSALGGESPFAKRARKQSFGGKHGTGKKRKDALTDDTEIQKILKTLGPIYRRRIFIEQLKSRWYVIAGPGLVLLTLFVVIFAVVFPMLSKVVEVFRPPPAIEAKFSLISMEGIDLMKVGEDWPSKRAHDWSDNYLIPNLTIIYQKASFPVKNITIVELKLHESRNQITKRSISLEAPLIIEYVVYPSEDKADHDATEPTLKVIVGNVRKLLIKESSWKVDPNTIVLKQGAEEVRASSARSFLASEIPPVELYMEVDVTFRQRKSPVTDCTKMDLPEGGDVEPYECKLKQIFEPGTICSFSCEDAYVMVGNRERICLSSGVWSGVDVDCIKLCPTLTPLHNGFITPYSCIATNATVAPATRCIHGCKEYFRLIGSMQRVCQDDGLWSSSAPVCKRKCPPLQAPQNGGMKPGQCEEMVEGDACTFSCDQSFVLQGETSASCDSDGRWTEDVPVCRKQCKTLEPVTYSDVHPPVCAHSSLYEGMTCAYTCHSGYQLVGSSARNCDSAGNWSNSAPTCVKTCEVLLEPQNGVITPISCTVTSSLGGAKCSFSCDAGYTLRGSENLTCLYNGGWDRDTPECVAQCPGMAAPENGDLLCSGTTAESTCALYCLSDHRLVGASYVICQLDGSWSEPLGNCVITCSKLSAPDHGGIAPDECRLIESTIGQSCSFWCHLSYGFAGSRVRSCLENGSWSGVATTCELEEQYMVVLDLGQLKVCLSSEDEKLNAPIKRNFDDCENEERNLWSIADEKLLKHSRNGLCIGFEQTTYLSRLVFLECDELDPMQIWDWPMVAGEQYTIKLRDFPLYIWYGYSTSPYLLATDEPLTLTKWLLYRHASLSFSSFYGAMNDGRCPSLPILANGRWAPNTCGLGDTASGTRCSFLCTPGYETESGKSTALCSNGLWEGEESPRCVRSCVAFNAYSMRNGTISPSYCTSSPYVSRGTICTFRCEDGHELVGEKNAACLLNGQWSSDVPECHRRCSPVTVPARGSVSSTTTCPNTDSLHEVGNVCKLACDDGYVVQGSEYRVCQANGTWNDSSSTCIRACSSPQTPNNGAYSCNGENSKYPVGTTCTYTCEGTRSLWPSSGDVITCLSSGVWNASSPTCQNFCEPLAPILNGTIEPSACLNLTNESLPNQQVCYFECDHDFALSASGTVICLEDGSWSNSPPSCQEEKHFMIQQNSSSGRFCLAVEHHPHHNQYEVVLLPTSQCNSSDRMHSWSRTSADQIRHVDTGWCLAVSGPTEFEVLYLRDCDSSDLNQRWKCQLEDEKLVVKLSATEYMIYGGVGPSASLRLKSNANNNEYTSWIANDTAGNDGSVCGMTSEGNGRCPKLIFREGATVSPALCREEVEIGDSCTVTCLQGYEFFSGATSKVLECLEHGKWSIMDVLCSKRKCNALTLPTNAAVSDPDCQNSNQTAWSSASCEVTCNAGVYQLIEPGNTGTLRCLGNGVWSEAMPQCLDYCSALTAPADGAIQPSVRCTAAESSKHGDVCRFSCSALHSLSGSEYLNCQNGTWNTTAPTCSLITGSNTCTAPSAPNYGRVVPISCSFNGASENETCSIECVLGFAVVPLRDVTSVCRADGTWSSPFPTCKKLCPNIDAPAYSSVQPERCRSGDNIPGDECLVVCDKLYALDDAAVLTCEDNGQWDRVAPQCIRRSQFLIANDTFCASASNETDQRIITKDCEFDDNYQRWEWVDNRKIRNVAKQKCLVPETETSYAPLILLACQDVEEAWECPFNENLPQEIVFKDLLMAHSYGDIEHLFVVNENEEEESWKTKRGTQFSFLDQVFSGSACLFRTTRNCPSLPEAHGGYTDAGCSSPNSDVTTGRVCRYFCNNGYKLSGQPARLCSDDGTWNDTSVSTCKKLCPALELPDFASVTPSTCSTGSMEEGDSCGFQCTSGFSMAGSRDRVCRAEGTWSGVDVICHRTCPPLSLGDKLVVSPTSCSSLNNTMGTICTSSCSNGFKLSGTSVRSCTNDGSWSGSSTQCHRSCPALRSITNGRVLPADCLGNSKKEGDACVFSCTTVFGIDGGHIRSCTTDGVWTGQYPKCLRTCQNLRAPTNGLVTCDRATHLAGDICTYSCIPDYVIDGPSARRTCQETGQWSDSAPVCVREHQFLLFQNSPPDSLLCLRAVDNQSVTMESEDDCHFDNASSRWAWYHKRMFRSVLHGTCLAGNILSVGSYLVLDDCDDTDPSQRWDCPDEERAWFVRLSTSKMYPLFSHLSTYKVLLFDDDQLDFVQKGDASISSHTQWYVKTALSDRVPVCSAKEVDSCPGLKLSDKLILSPQACSDYSVKVGTECYLHCEMGYALSRSIGTTSCLRSGHWSHEVPECVSACRAFNIPQTSTLQASPTSCTTTYQHSEGFACKFSCPSPSVLVGNAVLTCMANSNWNFDQPTCRATCAAVNTLAHGKISPQSCYEAGSRVLEGTRCVYTCLQSEHVLSGISERLCTHTGQWSEREPKCVKPCLPHLPVTGGDVLPASCLEEFSLADTVCAFSCDNDLVRIGSQYRVCQANGTWSGSKSFCQAGCPTIPRVSNGSLKPGTCEKRATTPGHTCSLTCSPGFHVRGEKVVVCRENGTWNVKLGQCIPMCTKLNKPLNGQVQPPSCLGGDLYEGSECTFSCEPSFILQGSDVRLCQNNGKWSGKEASCRLACPALGLTLNVLYNPPGCSNDPQIPFVTCVTYCPNGMATREGVTSIVSKCNENGTWSEAPLSECHRRCYTPVIENGVVDCWTSRGDVTYAYVTGTVCRVVCEKDHILTSAARSVCEADLEKPNSGVWSPPLSQCAYEPDPMIIFNRVRSKSVCFGVEDFKVISVDWNQCQNDSFMTGWVWRDNNSIRNTKNGLCLSVSEAKLNVYVTTSTCNDSNPLQYWTCRGDTSYALTLSGTSLAMTVSAASLGGVILSNDMSVRNMIYTYNPNSDSGVGTVCSRKETGTCSTPFLPVYARVEGGECGFSGTTEGTVCPVICQGNRIYFTEIRCLSNGLWTPSASEVCQINCDKHPALTGGAFFLQPQCSEDSVPPFTACSVGCPAGYVLSGKQTKTECLRNGSWAPLKYACVKSCPKISSVDNGVLVPTVCVTGQCMLRCNPGYRLHDSASSLCLPTGQWSGKEFSCVMEVQFVISSEKKFNNIELCLEVDESEAVYKQPCTSDKLTQLWRWSSHYTLESVFNRQCLSVRNITSGSSLSATVANSQSSNIAQDGSNSEFIDNRNGPGNIITSSCDQTDSNQRWSCGSHPEHSFLKLLESSVYLDADPIFRSQLHTKSDGHFGSLNWDARRYSGRRKVCAFRATGVCPPVQDIYGGSVSPAVCKTGFVVLGTHCRFSCSDDFTLEGEEVIICNSNGKWSNLPPFCVGLEQCPKLDPVKHLSIRPASCVEGLVPEGYSCRFQCRDNTVLIGTTSLLCGSRGEWNGSLPECRVTCPALFPPANGHVSPAQCEQDNVEIAIVCSFSCDPGHTMVGGMNRTCTDDGSWSEEQVFCKRYCPILVAPTNGLITPTSCLTNDSAHGTTCDVSCDFGFALKGPRKLRCSEGNWTLVEAVCAPDMCAKLVALPQSIDAIEYRDTQNGAIVPNTVAFVTCRPGYDVIGPQARVCLQDGTWSGGNDTCEVTKCPFVRRLYRGSVNPSNCTENVGVAPGVHCYFACDEGYKLSGPTSVECQPGGSWSDVSPRQCEDTYSKPYLVTFVMILRETGAVGSISTSCLEARKNMKSLTSSKCKQGDPYLIWRWFGSYRIQNVGNQLCLKVNEDYSLVTDTCLLNDTSQYVFCGDINSPASRLRLKIGKLYVGRSSVHEKSTGVKDLAWSASMVGYSHSRLLASPETIVESSQQPICSAMCGGNITSGDGHLSSPSFPNFYPSNVHCVWRISTDVPNSQLEIDFSDLSLRSGTDEVMVEGKRTCQGDYLAVYGGTSSQSDLLKLLCRSTSSFRTKSLHGSIRVEFYSGHERNDAGTGFSARWVSNKWSEAQTQCGVHPGDLPISSNDGKAPSRAPWQIAITYRSQHVCNGALITKLFVVSAANCVGKFLTFGESSVIMAVNFSSQMDLIEKKQNGKFHQVRKIWVHSEYDDTTLENDVAIVMSQNEFELDVIVQPICLPKASVGRIQLPGSADCWAVQWSRDMFYQVAAEWEFTHYNKMEVLEEAECRRRTRASREWGERTTCAVRLNDDRIAASNTKSVDADQDSILQCRWNGNWYLVGMQSFVFYDVIETFVYTSIVDYDAWIHEQIINAFYNLRSEAS